MGGERSFDKIRGTSLPTYAMGCFKLPRVFFSWTQEVYVSILMPCYDIFWWGTKHGRRRTTWVSWNDMRQPNYMGSMGLRKMELFNLSLLAIQSWRLIQEPNTLSALILKAIYFLNGEFLTTELEVKTFIDLEIHCGR